MSPPQGVHHPAVHTVEAMDIESQPSKKRVADFQVEDLEHVEQMVQRPPTCRGEYSDDNLFIGNREHDESVTHKQYLEDKVVVNSWVSTKVWTSRQ